MEGWIGRVSATTQFWGNSHQANGDSSTEGCCCRIAVSDSNGQSLVPHAMLGCGLGQLGIVWIPRAVSQPSYLYRSLEGDLSNASQWPLQAWITSAPNGEREWGSYRSGQLWSKSYGSVTWRLLLLLEWIFFILLSLGILLSFFEDRLCIEHFLKFSFYFITHRYMV